MFHLSSEVAIDAEIIMSAEMTFSNENWSIAIHTSIQIVATREAARPIQSICLAFTFQLPPILVNGRKAIQAIVETHAMTGGM
jgi:hypothetical protein